MGVDRGAIAGEGLRIVATHGLGGRDLCDAQESRLSCILKLWVFMTSNLIQAPRIGRDVEVGTLYGLMLIYAQSLDTPKFQPYQSHHLPIMA